MIHHLVRDVALADGGLAAVKEELRYAYGEAGLMAARGWASGALAAEAWRLPLFERLVDRSRAVFVHTAAARRRVLGARPEARVHRVPHGLDLSALPAPGGAFEDARRRGRRALGVADDALLLGTFGYVTRAKRLELLLAVFGRLRRRFPGARLVIAGEVSGDYDLPSLLGGVQGVLAPGRLPREAFLRAMAATDVALNLRHPSGGESSATLLQLLALARPVVVSAGAAEDLPPGTCAPVAVDPREEEQLLATLLALAEEPELRAALGREARAWIEAECRREHAARGTLDALEAVLEAPALSSPADLGVAVSPLAPFPETDPLPALAASLGADLVDLGLGEAAGTLGEEARRVVAEVMVDLDLDRSSGSPSTAGRSG